MRLSMPSVALFMFVSYLFLKPFYFWSSGIPQVSDLFAFLAILITSLYGVTYKETFRPYSHFKILLIFVFYTFLINIVHSFINQSLSPIIYSIYYFFNFSLAFCFLYLIRFNYSGRVKFHRIMFALAVMMFIISLIYPDQKVRKSFTFNNPNQLGAFCMMLVFFISYYFCKMKDFLTKRQVISLFSSVLMIFFVGTLSYSAGAVGGMIFLIFLMVFFFNKRMAIITVSITLALSYITFQIALLDADFKEVIEIRLDKKESNSDIGFIKERGYDRILNHPEQLLIGGGEGLRERWNSFLINEDIQLELHSTVGTIVFSYGIPGLIITLYYIFIMCRRDPLFLVFIVALFPYLITHNMLRNPLFWFALMLPFFTVFEKSRIRES